MERMRRFNPAKAPNAARLVVEGAFVWLCMFTYRLCQ